MPADYRYVKNEASYLNVAEMALAHRFESKPVFHNFYRGIGTLERKNQFLRAASVYFYLVKNGDWKVTAPDCNPVIDYFTNSYKTVGIFAIIESLSDESHQDFHQWLRFGSNVLYPIESIEEIDRLHKK